MTQKPFGWLAAIFTVVLGLQVGGRPVFGQKEIGFLEKYALASDRKAILAELIPGTEEFFYFSCLHHQVQGELAAAQAIIDQWRAQFGDTSQVQQMVARQMLLTYDENPQRALDFLRDRLGLNFFHSPPSRDLAAELPSKLDNSQLTQEKLLAQSIAQDRTFHGLENSNLNLVIERPMAPDQLRAVLNRVERADLPKLVDRIAEELAIKDSAGFGWAPIHSKLTLSQLEQLLQRRPSLLEQDKFVREIAARMAPPQGTSLSDKKELRAYIQRLLALARRLPESQNSFKAMVLGNLLKLDLSEGKYDRPMFLEYLSLPRNTLYYDLTRFKNRAPTLVEFAFVMSPQVMLPAIGDDTSLVRAYLEHFLKDSENVDDFAKLLQREYLDRVQAETKILSGIGDASLWYAKLSAADQKAIRERVELQFAPQNKNQFDSDDAVQLLVDLKNVPQLIIKIYKINTLNHYRQRTEPINTDIDLDGLVANAEKRVEYSQAAPIRHRESIDLPELAGRGVWVVDILGGGQRSRAVIQKGSLVGLERLGDAGHVFHVVDEKGASIPSAYIELGGRTYEPSPDGKITLPFAEQNTARNILIADGDFAVSQLIVHRNEAYELQAGFLLDRQALVAGAQASLAIRARLSIHGRPISIRLLEEPRLTITATDCDGIATTQTIGSLDLDDGDDFVHKFLVPQRLANLSFQLSGRVFNQNRDERQSLQANHSLNCNGIQKTNQIADFFLRQSPQGYRLHVLGRNGEAIGRLPITISAKVEGFVQPVHFTLATNEQGSIDLGPLVNVQHLVCNAQGIPTSQMVLQRFHRQWPSTVHAGLDSKILLPLGKEASEPSQFTLLEWRAGANHSLHTDKIKINNGAIEISGLASGDFILYDHETGQQTSIVVADANDATNPASNFISGKNRSLQRSPLATLAIRNVSLDGDNLIVEVTGNEPSTRIHLMANPLCSDSVAGASLHMPHVPLMQQTRLMSPSLFVDSLRMDEEYSYILQRQGVAKFPGNMLAQPTLLIKPWEVSKTNNSVQTAKPGDGFGGVAQSMAAPAQAKREEESLSRGLNANSKCFDFLSTPSSIAANIELENGKASIPIKMLKGYCNVTVFAIHATGSDSRIVVLPESELQVRDQRLRSALSKDVHLAQTQRVEVLKANQVTAIGDPRNRRVQSYASIGDVFRLYGTLLNNPEWEKFRFVAQWHSLSNDERRSRYNEMACHELNFFLYHKDRKFFDEVVRPLIANKLDKQLMDQWLLGESLASYDQLWRLQRLNTLERILLAQSIEAKKTGTRRWLGDFVGANPVDPQWRSQRFEVALRGMLLDAGQASAKSSLSQLNELGDMVGGGMGMGGMGATNGAYGFGGPPAARLDMNAEDSPAKASKNKRDRRTLDAKSGGPGGPGLPQERNLAMGRRILFASLDQTREWAETQYYRIRLQSQTASLIPSNPFWLEYLQSVNQGPFLPSNLDLPTSSVNEALCALAVIDLPLEGVSPEMTIENDQLKLATKNAAIAFIESIEEAKASTGTSNIMVGQDIYLAQPNTNEDSNRPLQGPLLRGIPYRASVVVTNPSNAKQLVQVLTQIPAGALPLSNGKATRSTALELAPYSTAQVQYEFYFPVEGDFEQYGSQISSAGNHLISTESKAYRVLAKPDAVDEKTWSYVADWGTDEQVIEFLKKANLQTIDLQRIAFRMQNKTFFNQVTDFLSSNQVFAPDLWAYAVLHNEPAQIQQFLQNRPDFVAPLGIVFTSPLIKLDVREQMSYEHLDYKPLVVARIHQLGHTAVILNDGLFAQYHRLLNVLAHQRSIDNDHRMEICYYMLLQNRIEEALGWFDRVDANSLSTRIQYDYFAAYLDFYRGQYDRASQVANKYTAYPVLLWKDLFAQVADHVRQRKAILAGQDFAGVTSLDGNANRQQQMLTDGREGKLSEAASATPSLDLSNQDGVLSIDYRNLDSVKVNYYLMDIELLFSRNPFVARSGDKVPVIAPNQSESIQFDSKKGSRKLDLPNGLQNRNLLVEVTSNGISKSTVVTANSLSVSIIEPFGRVQVLSARNRSPLERTYVKVYARHKDGTVSFYKDGYTDLRGQFDYATLSTSTLDTVDRFAILILHEAQGAIVREAVPPTR